MSGMFARLLGSEENARYSFYLLLLLFFLIFNCATEGKKIIDQNKHAPTNK
jgi:hypothetical protein